MKTTMRMRDLKRADGFPLDIDRSKLAVVQVIARRYAMIFYVNKEGAQIREYIPGLSQKYAEGIYIIKPES